MAFTDEIRLYLQAGKGGDGVVRWRHEKYKEFAGPSGGNGAWGGNVYAHAVRDISRLSHYAQFTELSAEDGQDGMKDSRTGKKGEDLVLSLPVGSVIHNEETGEEFELLEEGDEVLLLRGGKGGLGNEHFKSSRNVTPREQTDGKPGEEASFHIEVRLIADVGFVGLPNAGKSTLLNELTGAKSKVGHYQFTTLEPHLGDMHGVILADIPGLIEGASQGRGLGHAFLRHISRTRLLAFCVSFESPDILSEYATVEKELREYDDDLIEKPRIIILTKSDTVSDAECESERKRVAHETGCLVYAVSILNEDSIKTLSRALIEHAKGDSNDRFADELSS